ncbi:hypothetical protein SDC9_190370 [bioreactor metagenome]|uniref:Uncharacterized protein n=1 Tax=bioreactor metagenome TaxID=1076179 RepID=A0A645HWG9_9ZZZZ
MLEAKVATIILPLAVWNIFSKVSPTVLSDMVYPGLSTLVLSAIITVTPFLPSSANLVKSATPPSIGVKSILKSPV